MQAKMFQNLVKMPFISLAKLLMFKIKKDDKLIQRFKPVSMSLQLFDQKTNQVVNVQLNPKQFKNLDCLIFSSTLHSNMMELYKEAEKENNQIGQNCMFPKETKEETDAKETLRSILARHN